MFIAGVVCLVAGLASATFGLRTLTRPRTDVLRAVAPTQLAAAVMFSAGGAAALAGPAGAALMVLVVCAVGAVGTLATGSWQAARALARREAAPACARSCAACTLPCS